MLLCGISGVGGQQTQRLGPSLSGLVRRLCGIIGLMCASRRRRFWMRLLPKPLGDLQWFDLEALPPSDFVAGLMQLPMMAAAERHRELVADFHPQRSGLGKPQVMRIGRLPAADEARL